MAVAPRKVLALFARCVEPLARLEVGPYTQRDVRGREPAANAFLCSQETAQQDVQAVYQVRQQLIKTRTAVVNGAQTAGLIQQFAKQAAVPI
jgi:hypothetical protein